MFVLLSRYDTPELVRLRFNEYFHSTFSNPINATGNDHDTDPHPDLNSIIVTELEVTVILQKPNVNKSCGPDDVSPVILKCFSSYLAPSLCSLFNRSLRDGIVPTEWLRAYVCPVYKGKGDKNCTSNYRPISLLSSKVAERCIHNHIMTVIGDSIYKNQHGFMEGKSTVTQLTQVFHEIGQHIDNSGQVDTLYLDFSKALQKMKVYGFNGGLYLNGLRPISQDVNNVYLFLDHYLNGFQSLQVFHRGLYWDPFRFYYTLTIYHFVPDLAKSHYLRMTSKVQIKF